MENDTLNLLKECDAGIQMGVASIDDVLDKVKSNTFRDLLNESKAEHERLRDEMQDVLMRCGDDGKAPNPMAKGMSKIKTEMMTMLNDSDATIADLMTEGCNMGVKSLSKYLNQYKNADGQSKDFTKRLIGLETSLAENIRPYL